MVDNVSELYFALVGFSNKANINIIISLFCISAAYNSLQLLVGHAVCKPF